MNSEKVKEIKEKLQEEIFIANSFGDKLRKVPTKELENLLTLIKELESENERLNECYKVKAYDKLRAENQQLKNRIVELENTIKNNLQYAKGYGDGVKATVEVAYPKKLNEFTEKVAKRLININGIKQILDETLKDFINKGE